MMLFQSCALSVTLLYFLLLSIYNITIIIYCHLTPSIYEPSDVISYEQMNKKEKEKTLPDS